MLTAPSPQLHLKQAQLEAVSKERGTLLDEVHRLREESAEARHTIKRLQQQQAAASASAAAVAAQQAQAQQAAGRQGEVADAKQQEPAGVQQEQQRASAAGAQDAAAEQGAEQERQRLRQEHAAEVARLEAELSLAHRQNAELQQQLAHAQAQPGAAAGAAAAGGQRQLGASPAASAAATPTAAAAAAGPAISAFISQSALREAAQHDQQPAAAEQAQQAGSLPPELAALLPAALYSLPAGGPSGVASGEAALQLTNSIYLLLDALEEDKRQMVAALNAKQVRGDGERCAGQGASHGAATNCRCSRSVGSMCTLQAVGLGGDTSGRIPTLPGCCPAVCRRKWSASCGYGKRWSRSLRRSSGGWSWHSSSSRQIAAAATAAVVDFCRIRWGLIWHRFLPACRTCEPGLLANPKKHAWVDSGTVMTIHSAQPCSLGT